MDVGEDMELMCRVCDEVYAPEQYPMCSQCGCFLVELEDLDLSPSADIVTIFKAVKLEYLQ